MTLVNSRMDEESLDAMLEAMKESMPLFRKYLRRKGELLGYKNGLPFYEMYAPVSEAEMKFTYEEAAKYVEKNFRTFSDHLADFAKTAVEKSWIDVLPKEGKVGGAFCHNLHFLGESRFLLNYGEQFGDVVTMAHELAPVSEAEMKFTYEEAAKYVEKNFRTFSDHLADFAKTAVEKSWIDVFPKEGKVGGAFCHNLHFLGESRFLLNYGEQFGDVVTMAHELGHGFHGECLKNEEILNSDYPMPIAETASTFCETIIKKAAIKDATKEEALAILENEISDCTQVIVDIYSRFLFEKAFFEKRRESALSVEEIKELMLNAQREAYGDGLDPEYLHPYMWTWKPHYYYADSNFYNFPYAFYADSNFYNFPYAFGLLFAKGLYAEYLKKGKEFTTEYENLLSITGKNAIADITKVVGIDIHNKEFWKNSLKTIEEDIEQFIELTK